MSCLIWVCLSAGVPVAYISVFNYPHETVGKMSAWNKVERAVTTDHLP